MRATLSLTGPTDRSRGTVSTTRRMTRAPAAERTSIRPVRPAVDSLTLESFRQKLDAIHRRERRSVGAEDLADLQSLAALSRRLEIVGRGLLYLSFDPVTFWAGVLTLSANRLLEFGEIGHSVLHGAYDRIDGVGHFHSSKFRWKVPIDEDCWRDAHNIRHHRYTNVVGRDPDVCFGVSRVNRHIQHHWLHRFQLLEVFFNWAHMARNMNFHVTGLVDVYGRSEERIDILPDKSVRSIANAHWRAARKLVPYYAETYLFYPAFAGPFFAKVAIGNWLAERIRDAFMGVTGYAAHLGPDVTVFPPGTRAAGRTEYYVMQVQATANLRVPRWVSLLVGGLDRQIEHHLFPDLPASRLRRLSGEIREICEEHGLPYHEEDWRVAFQRLLGHLRQLSVPPKTTEE